MTGWAFTRASTHPLMGGLLHDATLKTLSIGKGHLTGGPITFTPVLHLGSTGRYGDRDARQVICVGSRRKPTWDPWHPVTLYSLCSAPSGYPLICLSCLIPPPSLFLLPSQPLLDLFQTCQPYPIRPCSQLLGGEREWFPEGGLKNATFFS